VFPQLSHKLEIVVFHGEKVLFCPRSAPGRRINPGAKTDHRANPRK